MARAKDLNIQPIKGRTANALVQRLHYSGKIVNNSSLHLGVFFEGRLEGAMQFGPSLDKRKLLALVPGTGWNQFLELNRMAFSDWLPKNSESRALGVALRMIRRRYPHVKWVVSFADATQCGDGTIYRAAGFLLTGITRNRTIARLPDGRVVAKPTITAGRGVFETEGGARMPAGSEWLDGYQLRYVYFLDPAWRQRLAVEPIPYSRIEEIGADMYRGQKRVKQAMA